MYVLEYVLEYYVPMVRTTRVRTTLSQKQLEIHVHVYQWYHGTKWYQVTGTIDWVHVYVQMYIISKTTTILVLEYGMYVLEYHHWWYHWYPEGHISL